MRYIAVVGIIALWACSKVEYIGDANKVSDPKEENIVVEKPETILGEEKSLIAAARVYKPLNFNNVAITATSVDDDDSIRYIIAGESTPVHWKTDGFSSGLMRIKGPNSETIKYSAPVEYADLKEGSQVIDTTEYIPGKYVVEYILTNETGDSIIYFFNLYIRPVIELARADANYLVINQDVNYKVFLPFGGDIATVSEGSSQINQLDNKVPGNYDTKTQFSSDGVHELTGRVTMNEVEGLPATLQLTLNPACGSAYNCALTEISQRCAGATKVEQTYTVSIPKLSGCNFGPTTGNYTAVPSTDGSYQILPARETSTGQFQLPTDSQLCNVKDFKSKHSIRYDDQLSILWNNAIFASSIKLNMSDLRHPETGFFEFDWSKFASSGGYILKSPEEWLANATVEKYCVGQNNVGSHCQMKERMQLGDFKVNPTEDGTQQLMAYLKSRDGSASSTHSISAVAYGDHAGTDDTYPDCYLADYDATTPDIVEFEVTVEYAP